MNQEVPGDGQVVTVILYLYLSFYLPNALKNYLGLPKHIIQSSDSLFWNEWIAQQCLQDLIELLNLSQ